MKTLLRWTCGLLAVCLLAGTIQTAEAQILKRAKDRLKQKLEEKTEEKAEEEVNKAVDQAAEEAAEEVVNAAAAAAHAQAGTAGALSASSGAPGEPVDFRSLKALLPESLPGLTRSEATGQKSSAMGIKMSSAEADFTADDGGNVHVTITDMGTMSGLAMFGYAWLNTEIDSETETGYERTTKYRGYPAQEKFDAADGYRHGELTVVVGQRFIIAVTGSDVDMDVVKAAADRIDISQLEAIQKEAEAAAKSTTALVDFRTLKALLPARAGALERTSLNGEQSTAFGISVSYAEAAYGSGDEQVRIKISDTSSMQGLTALGFAWFTTEVDRESDGGYERTFKYKDHPAYMKYENGDGYRHAQMQVIVGQRFSVELQGDNVEMDALQAALDALDLTQLTGM